MYNIVIAIKNSPNNLRASFKEQSTAMAALENIRDRRKHGLGDATVTIKGDYGQIIDILLSEISGVLLMSAEGENAASIDGEILKARASKTLQDKLQTDPILGLTVGIPQRLAS